MLKTGHWCAAILFEANVCTAAEVALPMDTANTVMAAAGAVVGVGMATWNDWDLNYYKDSWNPFIGVVRRSAEFGYTFHTAKDRETWARREKKYDWEPGDLHRGPTHCTEWCLAVGALIAVMGMLALGPFGLPGWWLGIGAFVGLFSHVCADAITPSGVPFSAIYNWLRHGEVWKRHAVGWKIPFTPELNPKTERLSYSLHLHVGPVLKEVPLLTWIRYPAVVAAEGYRDGCRPGLCRSDRAGDKKFQIYMMLPASVICSLLWLGAFNPVAHALTWGVWPG